MTRGRPVTVLPGARADIEAIYRYIAESSGLTNAERILVALEAKCESLSAFAERGNVPKELLKSERKGYRELHYKPYRIFYRIDEDRVYVYCISDGRRDMPTLLRRRLSL